MKITLDSNLDEVTVGNEPLPAGEYRIECLEEPSKEQGENSPFLQWRFEVVNHPEFEGKVFTHNTALSKKAIEAGFEHGLKAVLEAFNIPWEVTPDGQTTFDPNLAPGQEAVVETDQEKEQDGDRVFTDVKAIYPLDE